MLNHPAVQFLLSDWTKLATLGVELAAYTAAAILGFVIFAATHGRVWFKLWVALSILAVHRYISVIYAALVVPRMPENVVAGLFIGQTMPSLVAGVLFSWALAQLTRTVWANRNRAHDTDLVTLNALDELKDAAQRSQDLLNSLAKRSQARKVSNL